MEERKKDADKPQHHYIQPLLPIQRERVNLIMMATGSFFQAPFSGPEAAAGAAGRGERGAGMNPRRRGREGGERQAGSLLHLHFRD